VMLVEDGRPGISVHLVVRRMSLALVGAIQVRESGLEDAVRISLLGLLSWLVWTTRSPAQTSLSGPAASVLFNGLPRSPIGSMPWEARQDTVQAQIRPTYWKEGALVGGVIGALGGALMGHGLCEMSEELEKNCTGSLFLEGVLGAALLAIPGVLIGGQFPKNDEADADRPE
jgi:hypothetical protein